MLTRQYRCFIIVITPLIALVDDQVGSLPQEPTPAVASWLRTRSPTYLSS